MRPFSILQLETWENLNRTFSTFTYSHLFCWTVETWKLNWLLSMQVAIRTNMFKWHHGTASFTKVLADVSSNHPSRFRKSPWYVEKAQERGRVLRYNRVYEGYMPRDISESLESQSSQNNGVLFQRWDTSKTFSIDTFSHPNGEIDVSVPAVAKKQMPTWEQWTLQWWLWPIQSLHLPAKLFELCVGTWPPVRSFPATLILFPSWKLLSVSQLGFVCPVLYTAKLQACFWKLEFSFFKIWNIDLCLGQGKLLVYVWFLPCGSRGLPRGIPADFMNSVFWSLTTAVGQLHQRLVSTYEGPQMNHSWPTTCVQWL